jgi:SOS-response transcriptional repressor LexA
MSVTGLPELTEAQRRIYDAICEGVRAGKVPTFREMCVRFGFMSPNAVNVHINALERKGYIKRGVLRSASGVMPTDLSVRPNLPAIPAMVDLLTTNERIAYNIIREYIQDRGRPPTVRELIVAMGCSPNSVHYGQHLLRTLQRKGLIHRKPGCGRAITLL